MKDLHLSSHRSASGLASLIGLLGVAGVAVLLASVALAVGGPQLDLPGVQLDARAWAVGSAALGAVALVALLAWMLRKPPAARAARVGPSAEAEAAAARAHAQLRALVQAVPQGLALSRDRRFEWANPRFCADLGWAGSELPGRSPYEVFSSVNADDRLGAALRTAFAAGQPYAGDLLFRRRDGSRFPGRLQARPIDPADPAAGTLWQLDDLSAPPVEQRQLGWAAHHDPLTGLLNRPGFEDRLAAWLQQAPPGQTASLLHVDLDGFKACNAAAGRDAGDALLRAAADTLLAHVRAGDAVARFEADTYALLLPGCVAAVAVQLGRRLRDELAGLGVTHQGQRLRVGATVGVAEIERPAASAAPAGRPGTPGVVSDLNAGQTAAPRAADWLARSHAAWYEAKHGGSGAVRLAAPTASVALVLPA